MGLAHLINPIIKVKARAFTPSEPKGSVLDRMVKLVPSFETEIPIPTRRDSKTVRLAQVILICFEVMSTSSQTI